MQCKVQSKGTLVMNESYLQGTVYLSVVRVYLQDGSLKIFCNQDEEMYHLFALAMKLNIRQDMGS